MPQLRIYEVLIASVVSLTVLYIVIANECEAIAAFDTRDCHGLRPHNDKIVQEW